MYIYIYTHISSNGQKLPAKRQENFAVLKRFLVMMP